ncbi:MAG TPA: energy transducer TonB, partial [Anaeromyxobacteraceae bacterium]|nr:energy transducer TonB [Anaeromyxobacteraceae bacterium]
REGWVAPAGYALSAALHAGLLAIAFRGPGAPPVRSDEVVAVEIEEAPRPEPPPVRPVPPKARRLAVALPADAPRAPAPEAPPPPNQPPSAEAPARAAPIRIGVAMEATTSAGAVAAPVGNTLYGRMPEKAPEPSEVQPYRSERYAPPTQVTSLPEPVEVAVPKGEYPREAARAGVEGEVKLRLLVDETGRVRQATVLRDPGHGLGPAGARIARRWFRFKPAMRGGEPVATEIPFTVLFELP